MNIHIDNKEITLKYSFRGFMIYEQLTEESFKPKGLKEIITLFYSMVMAADKEISITYDAFINWLDDNPKALNDFSEWLSMNVNRDSELAPDIKGSGDGSKN